MQALIGIDPHKVANAAVALDERGQVLAEGRFLTNRAGLRQLERWGHRFPSRRWAIEGAQGLGRPLAQRLVARGETVIDVPAKLSARIRLLSGGHGRKTDALDARSTALAAHNGERLTQVQVEDHTAILRLLSDRRDDLVTERTRTINRLHVLLRELVPGGVNRNLSAESAAAHLRRIRTAPGPARARRQLASELVADVRRLDRQIADLERRIRQAVRQAGTTLTELFGLGPVLAAKIIGHVGHPTRFPTKAHFASYTGTAPIEASSGEVVRHRLSRGGNRQLNHCLHMAAIVQVRHDTPGRAYYLRKRAEGKSEKEALRCLKRRISDAVFRVLCMDEERTP